jgi:hypothetical protein
MALGVAKAATIIGGGGALDEQVHSTGAQSFTTVTGISTPTGYFVDISSTDTINVAGGGAAQFNCAGSGCSSITVTPLGPPSSNKELLGFSAFEFDLAGESRVANGDFDVTVNFLGGGSQTFTDVPVNSNSKYVITAGLGETITSVIVDAFDNAHGAPVLIEDIKIISFDAVDAVVPEPATWLMMFVGIGAVGGGLRMSRRQAATRLAA